MADPSYTAMCNAVHKQGSEPHDCLVLGSEPCHGQLVSA